MSSSRCLRSAFEACRPSRTYRSNISSIYKRTYADSIKEIPKPEQTPKKQPIATQLPAKNPPKRSLPTLAKSTSSQSNSQDQTSSTPSQPIESTETSISTTSPSTSTPEYRPIPPNVLAAYRTPLKHPAPHGVPVASLQLRSYSIRSLEYFSDFALRAAYYLNLPASGPVPLPKRIERWTMPRSNFVHKKSQENFERITYKRLITVMDGDSSVVEVWLAVLRKWQFWGVGMKANVWEWEGLDVTKKMDKQAKDLEAQIDEKLAMFAWNKSVEGKTSITEMLQNQGIKSVGVPMTDVREKATRGASQL